MALGDYILCCKCDVKLLYDGAEENRKWWKERFGSEPEIMCPDCQKEKRERVVFPTMLRKMWSGSEVQAWLDEHVNT